MYGRKYFIPYIQKEVPSHSQTTVWVNFFLCYTVNLTLDAVSEGLSLGRDTCYIEVFKCFTLFSMVLSAFVVFSQSLFLLSLPILSLSLPSLHLILSSLSTCAREGPARNVDNDSCYLAVGFHYWRQLLMEVVNKVLRCTFSACFILVGRYNKFGDEDGILSSVAVCTELGCDRDTCVNRTPYCHHWRSAAQVAHRAYL
mgnify:CR=1 FL=1